MTKPRILTLVFTTAILGLASAATITLPDKTPGSVLFMGTSGDISESPNQLVWDNTDNRFGIGVTAAALATRPGRLFVAGNGTDQGIFVVDNNNAGGVSESQIWRKNGLTLFSNPQTAEFVPGYNPGIRIAISGNPAGALGTPGTDSVIAQTITLDDIGRDVIGQWGLNIVANSTNPTPTGGRVQRAIELEVILPTSGLVQSDVVSDPAEGVNGGPGYKYRSNVLELIGHTVNTVRPTSALMIWTGTPQGRFQQGLGISRSAIGLKFWQNPGSATDTGPSAPFTGGVLDITDLNTNEPGYTKPLVMASDNKPIIFRSSGFTRLSIDGGAMGGDITSFQWTTNTYRPLGFGALTHEWFVSGTSAMKILASGHLQYNKPLVLPGGGQAAVLGSTGGAGPVTRWQNSWMELKDRNGTTFWVPVWK